MTYKDNKNLYGVANRVGVGGKLDEETAPSDQKGAMYA